MSFDDCMVAKAPGAAGWSVAGVGHEVQSSIPIVQALHHGTLHRGQVCAILTGLGIEPPDLQVWTYGEAT